MNPRVRLRKPSLFDVMRRLKVGRTSIVYVSHRFEELYAVCDGLRDGRIVTQSLATLNRLELVCICWVASPMR